MEPEILLFIIKLITGGIIAFLAILIMSKKRTVEWGFMVAGFLLSYAALVYELLNELGVLATLRSTVFGIPVIAFICTIVPSICFIISFIISLINK